MNATDTPRGDDEDRVSKLVRENAEMSKALQLIYFNFNDGYVITVDGYMIPLDQLAWLSLPPEMRP